MELTTYFIGSAEVLFFTIVVPSALLVWVGYGLSRLAQRLASRQQAPEYPTAQVLKATFHEPPEQWPPAPTVEPPAT